MSEYVTMGALGAMETAEQVCARKPGWRLVPAPDGSGFNCVAPMTAEAAAKDAAWRTTLAPLPPPQEVAVGMSLGSKLLIAGVLAALVGGVAWYIGRKKKAASATKATNRRKNRRARNTSGDHSSGPGSCRVSVSKNGALTSKKFDDPIAAQDYAMQMRERGYVAEVITTCPVCSGQGDCVGCKGTGCAQCSGIGMCSRCDGRGEVF